MRERPILMTPEHAQKCHDGTKTQTRRLNGLEEVNSGLWDYPQMTKPGVFTFLDATQANPYNNALDVKCPYGVGDRLWVREAWAWPGEEQHLYKGCPADRNLVEEWKKDQNSCQVKWTPSIHMPRFACRTVLEITEVRVERVKDITPSDALAEGVFCPEVGYAQHGDRAPVLLFGFLWESINGKGSWERNDWVWVLTFREVA